MAPAAVTAKARPSSMSQSSSSAIPITPTSAPATTSATSDPAFVALLVGGRMNRPVISDRLSGEPKSLEPAAEEAALAERREDEDCRVRDLFAELLRRLEPVHAGHTHVHDHDVGLAALGEGDRAGAVGGLADHADVGRAGQREA